MIIKTLIVSIFMTLSLISSAHAQSIPFYDVKTACQRLAGYGGSYSNLTYIGCMDMEQSTYNDLKSRWDRIPGYIKRQCMELAKYGGGGSHLTLGGCVDMEMDAARESTGRSFRY